MAAVLQQVVELSRRELVSRGITAASWGAFAVVSGAGAVETLRFFFPRVLFHPPSRFRIGVPEAFVARGEGAGASGVILVDERWKAAQRFFVIRDRERIYTISARCAHLGCTVNWFGDEWIFKCPCHGSEYRADGTNFAGPAPRPLDRFRIELNVDGELVVDTSIAYGPERFDVDGAYVRIAGA